ncbi:hypothetical protein [Streptomyces sp. NPDC101165]|uniref:hypothetical protein n=1 Tax=Streptomyces sp. NPDC101165 TaxID=3366119 RepID=UPI003804FF81
MLPINWYVQTGLDAIPDLDTIPVVGICPPLDDCRFDASAFSAGRKRALAGPNRGCRGARRTSGGHRHTNGDDRADVAASVYVGPRAAVFGSSTVTGNVRIEDLSWVNSGATISGNGVVKDSADVQGGESDVNPVYGAFTDQERAITI